MVVLRAASPHVVVARPRGAALYGEEWCGIDLVLLWLALPPECDPTLVSVCEIHPARDRCAPHVRSEWGSSPYCGFRRHLGTVVCPKRDAPASCVWHGRVARGPREANPGPGATTMTRTAMILLAALAAWMGTDCQGTPPAAFLLPTPLPPGVFTGTATCDVRITSPGGTQTTEDNTQTVTFEIDDHGVPIVQGERIRVGRTVELEGILGTYTRIQATNDGIVVHSDMNGAVNGVSFSGIAIATMSAVAGGEIEYGFTQTSTDSQGFSYNTSCNFTCEHGFSLTGRNQLVCRGGVSVNGTWNHDAPECKGNVLKNFNPKMDGLLAL